MNIMPPLDPFYSVWSKDQQYQHDLGLRTQIHRPNPRPRKQNVNKIPRSSTYTLNVRSTFIVQSFFAAAQAQACESMWIWTQMHRSTGKKNKLIKIATVFSQVVTYCLLFLTLLLALLLLLLITTISNHLLNILKVSQT